MSRLAVRSPTAEHQAIMAEFKAVLQGRPEMPAQEMLAVVSQLVGNLIALQDQTKITPAMAAEIVNENIVIGNQEAIRGLAEAPPAGHG